MNEDEELLNGENERGLSAVMSYMQNRIELLKRENAQLQARVVELSQNNNGGRDMGENTLGQQEDETEKRTLEACQQVALVLATNVGSRQSLDNLKNKSFVKTLKSGDLQRGDDVKLRDLVTKNRSLLSMRFCLPNEQFSFCPLHLAADSGNRKMCEILVEEYGADLFQTDVLGRTALHLAAKKLHSDTVDYLKEKMGVERDISGENAIQDMAGVTPAGYAALSVSLHMDYELMERKAKLDPVRRGLHAYGDCSISPLKVPSRRSTARNRKSGLRQRIIVGDKADERHCEDGLTFGWESLQGYRVAMEDAVYMGQNLGLKENLSLFAVFDGHGGSGASEYCAKHLRQVFEAKALMDPYPDRETMKAILYNLCIELDRGMEREFEGNDNSGTTATMVAITPEYITVANVGDSRTLIVNGCDLVQSTRDHTQKCGGQDDFWNREVERIGKAGGKVDERGRVLLESGSTYPSMAMSRALGDFDFKKNPELPIISCEPEIYQLDRVENLNVVLASDGIWDVVTNQKMVEELNAKTPEEDLNEFCTRIARNCLDLEVPSHDNMSLIVVNLGRRGQPPSVVEDLTSKFDQQASISLDML